jgi:release factor glutamine methyltransferase
VLVPRPETEEVVTYALSRMHGREVVRVLDIGTGSGAIALAIKQAQPMWEILATEVSPEALSIAQANGERLGLSVSWSLGHLATHISEPCDLIVANLPYIGENERAFCDPELAYEPSQALFSGSDGLDLMRELLPDLTRILAPDGHAILEHGWQQGPTIQALADTTGWRCDIMKDSAGKDRFAHLQHRTQ